MLVLLLVLAAAAPAAAGYQMYTESLGQLYGGGIWTRPLANSAPTDRESSALVSILDQRFPGPVGSKANFSVRSGNYLYIASTSTRLVKVTLDPGAPYEANLQQAFNQVPIPSYAQPSPDTDERMAILQPSSSCTWEFWHLHLVGGAWHAGWGGRDCGVWGDLGYYRNVNDAAGNVLEQYTWGAPSTSFDEMAGTIMVDELSHGAIPHAISFAVDGLASCATYFNSPAQRTDGLVTPTFDAHGDVTNCIPEGAQFRLPPPCPSGTASTLGVCFNLSDLAGDPPIITAMATAAQKYGLITNNRTSGGTVHVESGDAQSAPYLVLGGNPYTTEIARETNTPFLGTYTNPAALALFPWKWLKLLQMHITSTPDETLSLESDPLSPLWPN